jgi:uncharacterized protein YeaO (DUF488 family)
LARGVTLSLLFPLLIFFVIMPKTIEIWTVQLSKWRLVRELGIHLLDITAKSGNPAFAPLYEDVMSYKHGKMNWDEYEAIYQHRMMQSKRENHEEWEKLKELPQKIAYACYCRPNERNCHRHVFKFIAADYLKDAQFEVIQRGELTGYLPSLQPEVLDKKDNEEHVLNT